MQQTSKQHTERQNGETSIQSLAHEGQELMRQVRSTTSEMSDKFAKTLSAKGRQVSDWTRNNPMQAVLIGTGVGLVIGVLARRALFGQRD